MDRRADVGDSVVRDDGVDFFQMDLLVFDIHWAFYRMHRDLSNHSVTSNQLWLGESRT